MSLAWTQKVKCEMKESSLYEQFTIYFFNMFVARQGREWTVVHPNSTPIDAYQSKVEWTVVHPNITPIDAYQSKVERESGCGTSQQYTHRCLSLTVASTQETTVCKCTSFVIYYKQHKNTNIIY